MSLLKGHNDILLAIDLENYNSYELQTWPVIKYSE